MLAISSGNRLSLVLGYVIQYLSGEGTFSGRQSARVIILNSNIGGVVVGGRLGRTTAHRGFLTGMEVKCVSHKLRESFKSGFRLCHSVFIGGGHFFRPAVSTCDHFEFKFWRGRRGRSSRPEDRPPVSCEHTILLEDTTLTPRIYCIILFHTPR